LIQGKPLPEDWSGKNFACHQLAMEARGDYFLFLDADVRVHKGLIRRSLGHLNKYQLTLLSLFPRQRMQSLGERLTVPVMNWILLSLLPLRLIRLSYRPSLAAANGQFMLFSAREYRQHMFHELVKNRNVEDIHIIRKIKSLGYRAHTMLSSGEVECRMYSSYRDGIDGFTRSLFTFFGGSGITLLVFVIFTTFGWLFVAIGMSWMLAFIYLSIAWLLRVMVSIASRQPVFWNMILQPLQQLTFIIMVVKSFGRRFRGVNTWKGRIIQFEGR
jgi:glycosyltransferase involved in cell wall biosynthesis